MKSYLVAASFTLGMLAASDSMAQALNLEVEVAPPDHNKYAYLLDLSTSLDTADLAAPECIPNGRVNTQIQGFKMNPALVEGINEMDNMIPTPT